MMKSLSVLSSILLFSSTSLAQAQARPEILVLGTFHMANPGHDLHSGKVDDVLSPDRQREMVQLLEILKRFHPTKIAIESNLGGERPKQYKAYLAGSYTLT